MRVILVAVKDLLFGSKIQEAAKRTQTTVVWAGRFDALRAVAKAKQPDVLIVDLTDPTVLPELEAIRAERPQVKVLGFCGHEQDSLVAQAKALGVAEVYTRGQFAAQVDRLLLRERGDEPSPAAG